MKKKITIILLGILNVLHGSLHFLQAIQSFILSYHSSEHDKGCISHGNGLYFDYLLHNEYVSIFWILIGIFTIFVGIKDFKHHKDCEN